MSYSGVLEKIRATLTWSEKLWIYNSLVKAPGKLRLESLEQVKVQLTLSLFLSLSHMCCVFVFVVCFCVYLCVRS